MTLLTMLRTSADHLLRLVNDVLDYSKIEADKLELEHTPFHLKQALDYVMSIFTVKAREKSIEISWKLDQSIPPNRLLVGDSHRLMQVFINLIGNSLKFTQSGSITVTGFCKKAKSSTPPRLSPSKIIAPPSPSSPSTTTDNILSTTPPSSSPAQPHVPIPLPSEPVLISTNNNMSSNNQGGGGGGAHTPPPIFTPSSLSSDSPPRHHHHPSSSSVSNNNRAADESQAGDSTLQLSTELPSITLPSSTSKSNNISNNENNEDNENKIVGVPMPEEGGEVELEFCVRDTGIGIAKENQHLLFSAFSQVENSYTKRFGGTGLGLAISQRLVRLMKGDIWVESEVGTGTSFHFNASFGVGEELPMVNQLELTLSQNGNDQLPSLHLNILVAEDNAVNQAVIHRMLRKLEHTVKIVGNGQLAVDEFELNGPSYDLILMDVQMPVMDGIEATRLIRRIETSNKDQVQHDGDNSDGDDSVDGGKGGDGGIISIPMKPLRSNNNNTNNNSSNNNRPQSVYPHIPIIALSAYVTTTDKDRCLAAGVDSFATKPINFAKLQEVIQEIFRKSCKM
eukprot:TRINITY_DN7475_c0_g3_i1.p1 TRINITY_DN7475_c0_g3~~TRINITY_DN7475_c0_g3_i1.p1  ORF type:complete len:607 (-),score=142.32 TRINITY_DN7475_c0_g3_i1:31-1725(-)